MLKSFFLFFCLLCQTCICQISAIDSVRIKAIEAMKNDTAKFVKDTTMLNVLLQKIDSTHIKPFKINPKLATKKSAMLPGWGQVYAKQYWFIPIIYAGFGASAYSILFNAKRYQAFRTAYFLASDTKATEGEVTINKVTKKYSVSVLKLGTNYYRRYRDLSWLSIPVVWAINILEINVAAHLKSFDMSDDISMKIEPSFEPSYTGLPTLGGKVVFAFK